MNLRFLLGAGIGYVLGTRAGREQYQRLVATVRDLADSEPVRDLRERAASLTGGAKEPAKSSAMDASPLRSEPDVPGTDPLAATGRDEELGVSGDPGRGGVVLPDLETSTSRLPGPVTGGPDAPSSQPEDRPSDTV